MYHRIGGTKTLQLNAMFVRTFIGIL